jgi:hypothetical protein
VVVREDQAFVLRLKPHSDPPLYTDTENESPSRGFRIILGDMDRQDISSSSSSSSITLVPSSTFSTLASPTSVTSLTSSPAADRSGSKSNIVPIIGGVVAGLVVSALVGVIVFLLLRLMKRKKEEQGEVKEFGGEGVIRNRYAHESYVGAVEIQAVERPVELEGRKMVHELGGQNRRTGE